MSAVLSHNERKHESRNPVVRQLIRRLHNSIAGMVRYANPQSVIEVGCGEGYVLQAIIDAGIEAQLHGFDISPAAVTQARRRVGNAAEISCCEICELLGQGIRGDVVLAIEVLEHLDNPCEMLASIAQLTARYVILSVPLEPWFQTLNLFRGKYVRRWGNHPEHVQRWTRRQFHDCVSGKFRIIDSPSVFPWTLVLAEVPRESPTQDDRAAWHGRVLD